MADPATEPSTGPASTPETAPDDTGLTAALRTPAPDHALARQGRRDPALLCTATGCGYTADPDGRAAQAVEREHIAHVAALQAGALIGSLGAVLADGAQLDALPEGAVVLPGDGRPRRKGATGRWHATGDPVGRPSAALSARAPLVVLSSGTRDGDHPTSPASRADAR